MKSIPVTDAFDRQDSMEELEVAFSPEQIEWLKQVAEARDISVGHVIRTVLTACIREEEESSSPDSEDESPTGDGVSPSFSEEANERSASGASSDDNLLNRLRSTAKQLNESFTEEMGEKSRWDEQEREGDEQKRTDPEEAEQALERSMDAPSDVEADGPGERSMFDMVE